MLPSLRKSCSEIVSAELNSVLHFVADLHSGAGSGSPWELITNSSRPTLVGRSRASSTAEPLCYAAFQATSPIRTSIHISSVRPGLLARDVRRTQYRSNTIKGYPDYKENLKSMKGLPSPISPTQAAFDICKI